MTLSILQTQVGDWSRKNFPDNKPHHPLLGVSEEVGELCHAHLKSEQKIRGTTDELYAKKCDAVGDIVIYLADYCERNYIDLNEAVFNAWEEVRHRDWTQNKHNGLTNQTKKGGETHMAKKKGKKCK